MMGSGRVGFLIGTVRKGGREIRRSPTVPFSYVTVAVVTACSLSWMARVESGSHRSAVAAGASALCSFCPLVWMTVTKSRAGLRGA